MAPTFSAAGVVCSDLARSLAFYRALGLDVPATSDAPHVEVDLGGGHRLLLDTVDTVCSFDPSWTPPTGGHRLALAFDCATPEGVDAAYAALVAAGGSGHLPPWDAVWGQRYATVLDPDGAAIDLFAALA